MEKEKFGIEEKNILLRNRNNRDNKKTLSRDKYARSNRKDVIEKSIKTNKVTDIKKSIKTKGNTPNKLRSIFSLNLKRKPPRKYSKEYIVKSLNGYIEIQDVDKIPINTYLKYITLRNGKQHFVKGGLLKYRNEKTITLTNAFGNNPNPIYWPVKRYFRDDNDNIVFTTIFFRKTLFEEAKLQKEVNQCQNIITEQNDMIEQLQREIIKYKKYIKMLKKNIE